MIVLEMSAFEQFLKIYVLESGDNFSENLATTLNWLPLSSLTLKLHPFTRLLKMP